MGKKWIVDIDRKIIRSHLTKHLTIPPWTFMCNSYCEHKLSIIDRMIIANIYCFLTNQCSINLFALPSIFT